MQTLSPTCATNPKLPSIPLRSILPSSDNWRHFWTRHPALPLALALCCGFALALHPSASLLLLVSPPLLTVTTSTQRIIIITGITLAALLITCCYQLPDLPREGVSGTATFRIERIRETSLHGRAAFLVQGRCETFRDASGTCIARRAPCSIWFLGRTLINPSYVYEFSATLVPTSSHRYQLRTKQTEWLPIAKSWSLANLRWRCKRSLTKHLERHYPSGAVRSFLVGLATGEFADKSLSLEFSRFGLQHLMAISGFHFAIVGAVLQMMLRPFLSIRVSNALGLLLLTSYYLFLGATPSIQRAWIASLIILAAPLLYRRQVSLNTLSWAMIVVLLWNPLQVESIGFQFSFLITATILLLYRPLNDLLCTWLRPRKLAILVEMDRTRQHLYILTTTLRRGIALNGAVHLAAIPLTLAFFHKFPLCSLLYNLFFPFFASLSLFLLLCGLLATPLPPIAGFIHSLNHLYTDSILQLIYHMPMSLDFAIRVRTVSPSALIGWFLLLFLWAVSRTKGAAGVG